jgi:hypothetical protein
MVPRGSSSFYLIIVAASGRWVSVCQNRVLWRPEALLPLIRYFVSALGLSALSKSTIYPFHHPKTQIIIGTNVLCVV